MIALLLALSGLAAEHAVEAEPARVTVFANKARVTRTTSLQLPAGRQEILFVGLPPGAEVNGVTADVTGSAKLGGIDMKRITATEVADKRVAEIDAKLRVLSDKRAERMETKSSYDAELKAVAHARTESAKALSAQMMVASSSPDRARALRTRLSAEETRARTEIRTLAIEIRSIDEEMTALKRERTTLGSSATDTWTATVQLEVARSGRVGLDLSYLVGGASWAPRYDLRGKADGSVELALSAMVSQVTGEDWEDVKLTVSSARPGRGTDVPQLNPFWLHRPQPRPRPSAKRSSGAAPSRAAPAPMAMADEMMAAPEPEIVEMEIAVAEVVVDMAATTFSVKRDESVSSDGSSRKVLLTTESLDADLRYVVVPRVDPMAYLVGEVTNTASFALLPGEAGVFLEGAFVGEFQLPSVPPGDSFDVAFGSDDRVRVRRKPVEIDVGGTGVAGRKAKAKWTWEIAVDNGHRRSIPVRVREQMPLTSRDDVEIKRITGRDEPGSEVDKLGRIDWEFDLGAGANRSFTWGYQVDYPAELSLGWME